MLSTFMEKALSHQQGRVRMASIHGSTYFVTGDWSVPRVRSES